MHRRKYRTRRPYQQTAFHLHFVTFFVCLKITFDIPATRRPDDDDDVMMIVRPVGLATEAQHVVRICCARALLSCFTLTQEHRHV